MPGERVVLGEGLVQPGQRLQDLLLVIGLRGVLAVLLQRQVEHRAGGRPPHAQVDPPGRHRVQLLEQLGDLEGAVVVHQDRPDPNLIRDVAAAAAAISSSGWWDAPERLRWCSANQTRW